MGIFGDGDGVAAAGAVFDGGIDAIIGRAAADNKSVSSDLAQHLFKFGFIKRIAGRFGDVARPGGLRQFRQQRKPLASLFQPTRFSVLNENNAIGGVNQAIDLRHAAFAIDTRRLEYAVLHIHYHQNPLRCHHHSLL